MFLIGPAVRSGIHGTHPDLRDLVDGDPRFTVDFRRVYAAVLEQWLGCPAAKVLPGAFEPLALLARKPGRPPRSEPGGPRPHA